MYALLWTRNVMLHLEQGGRLLRDALKQERDGAGDEAPVSIAFGASSNGKGFARASLTVGKDGGIYAFQGSQYQILGQAVKYLAYRKASFRQHAPHVSTTLVPQIQHICYGGCRTAGVSA